MNSFDKFYAFKVTYRCAGVLDWPTDTYLYLVNSPKYLPFYDSMTNDKRKLFVGNCKKDTFKTLNIKIDVPSESGTFTYDFRLGTESEGLFGDIL